ncbi:Asp-tRNA(Asn)/Glu-tRNA(Gln) amidotransferase subunit GatB [Salisaeta longa]|uniref:Asp-tRNA(Asn)/Glu-tRNA(Gln) amidotransferase subunit GatB n=1 Tax=Salisaeta longa TaxID=503170 RepID=UPI0003B76F94|nr:Asp-tRNA(Asn)/Glu-tRNA(Gln) amidotransferase subunit GatB [Salisaeta longa]
MLHDEYEPVIGLEVHCQLRTSSKLFSPEAAQGDGAPNTQVDPVSLGHPGTLPVLNKKAVAYAVRMGLATHCSIAEHSTFARKHYFYPDLPKGYQISQHDMPLCYDGYLDVPAGAAAGDDPAAPTRRVHITRIHLEEDAGKSMHSAGHTRVDYNRCGVPLIEIVTAPDVRHPREASRCLQTIRRIVRYLGISDGTLADGSLRCDANISVRRRGHTALGTRTEVKNLNSIRHVADALTYEALRHMRCHIRGAPVTQATLRWDAAAGQTRVLRTKEDAPDYRYMPDPDLPPVVVDEAMRTAQREALPEMPDARRERFINDIGLSPYAAGVLVEERSVADYFEDTLRALFKHTKGGDTTAQAQAVANFIMTNVLRERNERNTSIDALGVSPERLAELVYLRLDARVSSSGAQDIFTALLETPNRSAEAIAEERNLLQVSDADAIRPVVDAVVADHSDKVTTYRNGKQGLLGFFIGRVMDRFDGSPDPQVVRRLLKETLDA